MNENIALLFGSGSRELVRLAAERLRLLYPCLPLCVVAEFDPKTDAEWLPYHVLWSRQDSEALLRHQLRDRPVTLVSAIDDAAVTYGDLRRLARKYSSRVLVFDERLRSFTTLSPWPQRGEWQHWRRRALRYAKWQLTSRHGTSLRVLFWRLCRPKEFRRPFVYGLAFTAGLAAAALKRILPRHADRACAAMPEGITVVIPSRDGRALLQRLLPGLRQELAGIASEIIVVDNGSTDNTARFLRKAYPSVKVDVSPMALSFAAAVNRGIRQARFSRLCLLNNDMVLRPGFFAPLVAAFTEVPDLFCATAQIFFPPGVRREETGKAVMPTPAPLTSHSTDFPLSCALPHAGESLSYVLYGSGGCSLYDTAKLHQIGDFSEIFRPAYVEDLDVGYRAWQRGWPTVYVGEAQVVHHHRQTTGRYYSPEALQLVVEVNYLRFLMRAAATPAVFWKLWHAAIWRLNVQSAVSHPPVAAWTALGFAARAIRWLERPPHLALPEAEILALTNGDTAVFPGRAVADRPRVLVASPYLPYPLSHGGAVRIYNLLRQGAAEFDQILVCFSPEPATPAPELLALCVEVVVVHYHGSHLRPLTERPDVVEEFDSPSFHAALRQTCRKWQPPVAQLEYTQMAQYAEDCRPARTLLVEHDVTLDLWRQYARQQPDWEVHQQLARWERFEPAAWSEVDAVITMSAKDQAMVTGAVTHVLPNGVDVARFAPSGRAPESRRILFVGSFRHLPNLLALRFFLREVWPLLQPLAPTLHIIAGQDAEKYLAAFSVAEELSLDRPGVLLEGFVSDVRPAYHEASLVIAPLLASAGTNIKVLEALAMGKAMVSTSAGVNGLDLVPGEDVLIADEPADIAAAIKRLLLDPAARRCLEQRARRTAVERFDWARIGEQQARLYAELLPDMQTPRPQHLPATSVR